jgi:hypothetical protein
MNTSNFTKKVCDSELESKVFPMGVCSLCNRERLIGGKVVCKDKNCDNFDYKTSVNTLCMDCSHECKQHSFVKVLQCKKFIRKETVLVQKVC